MILTLSKFNTKNSGNNLMPGCFYLNHNIKIYTLMISRTLKNTKGNLTVLTQHNKQLQNSLAELDRINKNYLRIMRVMAHDLRNPLSGMTGLASMLMVEDEFSEDSKYMLKLIETTGLHSMEMINELLKSGLDNDDEPLVTQKLDLRAMVYDSIELLQFRAKEKKQEIIFENDLEPIMAEINHEKIWRVINNLIVNAIKFSYSGSTIKVGIKTNGKNILIWVADNGIGIPAENHDVIFEMFTPAKRNGTHGEQPFGLGLSISKKIVELHNGKIWFEDNAGNGTVFYIQLPGIE
jgi:signal transduction histidine kinase